MGLYRRKTGLELKPPSLYQLLSELEEMGLIRDVRVEVVGVGVGKSTR